MFAPGCTIAFLFFGLAAPVELRWEGPPSCPADAFHGALAGHVGASAAGGTMRVRAVVREERGRWILDLEVADADAAGARRLTADRCETVVDAAAFVVAQALGGAEAGAGDSPREGAEAPAGVTVPVPPATGAAEGATPATTGGAVSATTAAGVVEERAAPATTTGAVPPAPAARPDGPDEGAMAAATGSRRGRGLRGAVRLRGGPDGGALPGVGADFGLVVGLLGKRWRVDLTSLGRLPVRQPAAVEGVGARLAMWAVGARGCGVPRVGRLAVPLCAGAEVGQVLGRGYGAGAEGRAALPWAAATVSLGLLWEPRPWLALSLEAELALALVRHDWVIRGLPPVHRLGPAQIRGLVGLEFRFGGAKTP